MSKKKHHESHGGAWKVAYADFVTAMMALFMVLWISSQQKEILIATSKYFQNPFTSPMPASSGVMNGKKDRMVSDPGVATKTFTSEMYMMLAKEFLKVLDLDEQAKGKKPIDVRVTGEGIVISLFNRGNQPLFDDGTSKLTAWGDYASQNLAWIIDQYHMRVRVDAHTPKNAVIADKDEDTYDLTAEQANIIRKRLVHYGLDSSKIDRVTGFGDSSPQKGLSDTDPANYRVELILSATPDTPAKP